MGYYLQISISYAVVVVLHRYMYDGEHAARARLLYLVVPDRVRGGSKPLNALHQCLLARPREAPLCQKVGPSGPVLSADSVYMRR